MVVTDWGTAGREESTWAAHRCTHQERHFSLIKISDLIRVDHTGEIIEGHHPINAAAFAIHSRIHMAHPRIDAAAHAHSTYGKTWSILGKRLDPLTQDACAFYKHHEVYEEYNGLVLDSNEGDNIAKLLDNKKAVILKNHTPSKIPKKHVTP